jgi:hypothetical protein
MKLAIAMLGLALPASVFAVDGVTLINQSTVMAAGGFPYKITQPGSYKLSGNLDASQVTVDAIQITVSNVTLDLNGFSIFGPPSMNPGAGSGVNIFNNVNFVIVRNGTISGFLYQVYQALTAAPGGGLFEDLVLTNGDFAHASFGTSSVVRHVILPGATSQISVTCPTVVTESVAAFIVRNINTTCALAANVGAVI